MKKMTLLLVAVMLAVLTLGGVTGAAAEEPIELSIWLTPQWKGVFEGTEEGAADDSFLKYAAERFTAEVMPNVTVTVQVITGEERPEKLNTAVQTNTLPNMFFDSSFTMIDYAHSGHLVALDDIISEESRQDISEGIWESNTVAGQCFFYPFNNAPSSMTYNADIFRQAGLDQYIAGEYEIATWTMDEYMEILNTLKEKTDVYPMTLFCLNFAGDTWNQNWLRLYGAEFWKDGKSVANDPKAVEALTWLKGLVDAGLTNPGPESISSNDMLAMMANQASAMGVTNSILFFNALNDMKTGNAPEYDLRLANYPVVEGMDPQCWSYVTSAMVFNSGTPEQIEAAKQFVKFFCEDEELVMASQNGCPVRASVSEKLGDKLPYQAAYNENSKFIYNFTGGVPGYGEQRSHFFPALQAALTGELTPQEALDMYMENCNKVIEEAGKTSVLLQ